MAAPALAGVPVTHRGLAAAVTVVTGHRRPGDEEATDWEALARVGGTVVVLMGVAERAGIAARLMAGGRPPDTPVAVVERAGTAAQRVVRGRLDELAELEVAAPATIVIGAVAALDLARWTSPGGRRRAAAWPVLAESGCGIRRDCAPREAVAVARRGCPC